MKAVLLCLLVSLSWSDRAGAATAHALRADLEAALGEGAIPRVETVIPGYHPGEAESGVVIGVFSSTRVQYEWGLALSEIVRDLVAHTPGVALRTPFADWDALREDAFHPDSAPESLLYDFASLQAIGARLGIPNGLLGDLDLREDDFMLTLTWHDLTSGELRMTEQLSGPRKELPRIPNIVAGKVFDLLGYELTSKQRDHLEATDLTSEHLEAYVELLAQWPRDGAADAAPLARELFRSTPGFANAATAWIQLAGFDGDELEINALVSEVANHFPDHSGVQLAAAQRWQSDDDRSMYATQQWLQAILTDNPNSMRAMWAFEEVLLASGSTAEAVSVALEAVRRWPDNYRSWWMCAAAITQLAWKARPQDAEEYAEAVELGTDTFLPLLSIADRTVDGALSRHPYVSELWRLKMDANPGHSREMLQAFERAIEYDPHNYFAYRSAMTFSAPRWGGSLAEQQKIYRRALSNNPEESWPDELYQYATGSRPEKKAEALAGSERNERDGESGSRDRLADYLKEAAKGFGCEGDCGSEIKSLLKTIGLVLSLLALLAAARSSNVETLEPPTSSKSTWSPPEDSGGVARRRTDYEQ